MCCRRREAAFSTNEETNPALNHPMQSSAAAFGHCVRAPDSSGLSQKGYTTS
jgi:hypothetical protein